MLWTQEEVLHRGHSGHTYIHSKESASESASGASANILYLKQSAKVKNVTEM